MTTMSINDPSIQKVIEEANRDAYTSPDGPTVEDPPDPVFRFAAGYMTDDGEWTKEFEVRELTGRDEEALARIPDVGRSLVAMIERGVVRLGPDPATPERLDSLYGGDWDTVLLAVRAVTFGEELELKPTCKGCGSSYEVTVNILKDLPVRSANPEDLAWTVEGRRHVYEMTLYSGATQRTIFDMMGENKSIAVINTEVLHDSIQQIDGMPVLGRDTVRDIPLGDRRALLDSIQERRVGPDLQGVKIKCPTCSHEQGFPLNAAALFQWN